MRSNRRLALGAALLSFALLAAACGNDDNGSGGGETGSTGGGPSIASQLTLGGPPECPQRPFCVIGLKDTYGVTFGDFKPLDVGGPLTVKALESGAVDVGLLFSTDPTIADKGFVVLEDDKHLQQAENITPLVRKDADSPELDDALNGVSAVLTTDNIVPLIKQVNDGA